MSTPTNRPLSTRLRAPALALAAALVGWGTAVLPADPALAATACQVDYRIVADWGSGFVTNTLVKNLGDPWPSYTVTFRFTGTQQITQTWNHTVTQTGSTVRLQSSPWVAPVGTGETATIGFTGSYTGSNPPPTDWRVNGTACSIVGQQPPDDDIPRIVATPTELTVAEGASNSFSLRLSHQPTASPVSVQISSTGTGLWAVLPFVPTFTATNWDTPISFPVYSGDDGDTVDDTVTFTLSAPGYAPATVSITQIDNDRLSE